MSAEVSTLIKKLVSGDRRALARVISFIENDTPQGRECLPLLYPRSGRAVVIGVTGLPGAGKSTLVDCLARKLANDGKSVGILAIDPSSPYSGGALLGDRIRMGSAADDQKVFIRSMASRGALGGLAPKTNEVIVAMDAAGFDFVVIETVGVGQGEVEIVSSADTVLVVLVPGMGDAVQALKAGILEIADIFVINKADYDGVERLDKELRGMLALGEDKPWAVPIVRTVASENSNIDVLLSECKRHEVWSKDSGSYDQRKRGSLERVLRREISEQLLQRFFKEQDRAGWFTAALDQLIERKSDPQSLVAAVLKSAAQK